MPPMKILQSITGIKLSSPVLKAFRGSCMDFAFDHSASLVVVRTENYCIHFYFYSLFDNREVSEIIMSSGRRRSSSRPSLGDVSGIGGAGQFLLDNHHFGDDNDEGVEETEPGVEAPNVMRGSYIPNPSPEPTDQPMISTSADEFDDQKSIGYSITSILQFRFSEPWATWSCVP